MGDIINHIKDVKKYSEGRLNIPFNYVVFLFTLLLVWQPDYIELIGAPRWVPASIKIILLDLANSIYSNYFLIFITSVGVLIILILLLDNTNIINKILPKDINLIDNTTISWNQYSAINRLIYIIKVLSTTWWIYYFFINTIFNENNYVNNFFGFTRLNNELIVSGYMSVCELTIMNVLLWINVLTTVYFVTRSLFEIKIPTKEYYIKSDNINYYIQLNSFQQKNSIGDKIEILILKAKYRKEPRYLLISVKIAQLKENLNDIQTEMSSISIPNRIYKVIDSSDNLDDITYHFESLKKKSDG